MNLRVKKSITMKTAKKSICDTCENKKCKVKTETRAKVILCPQYIPPNSSINHLGDTLTPQKVI